MKKFNNKKKAQKLKKIIKNSKKLNKDLENLIIDFIFDKCKICTKIYENNQIYNFCELCGQYICTNCIRNNKNKCKLCGCTFCKSCSQLKNKQKNLYCKFCFEYAPCNNIDNYKGDDQNVIINVGLI